MIRFDNPKHNNLLLLVAGAKGAVATTIAAALTSARREPSTVLPSLTTDGIFETAGPISATSLAGWDTSEDRYLEAIRRHGVLPPGLWEPLVEDLERTLVYKAPDPAWGIKAQIDQIRRDINDLRAHHNGAQAVFVNLLPAAISPNLDEYRDIAHLMDEGDVSTLPDMAYTLAAIQSGIPVVNFTPNPVEIPVSLDEALKHGVPVLGRDGKTGQTYIKVVLASAFKARNLQVNGWYSLNILGNADGANLMDPGRAAGKLHNKTNLLDEILEYTVGHAYGEPAHKVHIDYYPPRGDAKEAWDVIDFSGLFGLPMSLRINLLGRDSILAAPMVLDLARWAAALQKAGYSGPIPELGFYFKNTVGEKPPLTFQDQLTRMDQLQRECEKRLMSGNIRND
jgi:myo-inositol-1-phosphate synthase